MLPMTLLLTCLLAGGEPRPVAMVVDVKGDVKVRPTEGKATPAERQGVLYVKDLLSAGDGAEITVVFIDGGMRELLKGIKGRTDATVGMNGCEPKTAVTRIAVPKKAPGSPVPDNKLGPRGAGLSIVLNQLDAIMEMKGFVAKCLTAGAIKPASREGIGEIFFEVADETKLSQVLSTYPRFPDGLREALFAHARASQVEGFAAYLLQKQPAGPSPDPDRPRIYALVLSADMAKRKGDNDKARREYKKAFEALGPDQAVAVLGRETLDWFQDRPQPKQGPYFVQASAPLVALMKKAVKDGFSLPETSTSLAGGWLKQTTTEWERVITVDLVAGKSYRLLGAGDGDAKNINLQLLDGDAKVVAQDVGSNPEAVVDFTPTRTGRYSVRLRLYASTMNLPCASMGVLLERDAKAPNANDRGQYVAEAVTRVAKLIDKANDAGYTLVEPSVALGGGWLKQDRNQWVALSTVRLTGGQRYRFLAGGDNDAKEVAVQIVDPEDVAKEYVSNKGRAQEGWIEFEPKTTGNYRVRLCLYDSRENLPCFCLGVVMSAKAQGDGR